MRIVSGYLKKKVTIKMSIDLSDTNLDAILAEVGEFGIYQVAAYLLICIPCALSGAYISNYMIIANTLTYR